MGDYKLRDDNYPEEDDGRQIPFKKETSFYETLICAVGHAEAGTIKKK